MINNQTMWSLQGQDMIQGYESIQELLCNIGCNGGQLLGLLGWKLERNCDSKGHGANMGHIWGRQDPGGLHVVPMNFAIWEAYWTVVNRVLCKSALCVISQIVVAYLIINCVDLS